MYDEVNLGKNLHFKQEKTKIFAPNSESIDLIKLTTAFPRCKVNISHEDQDINGGLKVLGIPFGDDNFIKNCLKSTYEEY